MLLRITELEDTPRKVRVEFSGKESLSYYIDDYEAPGSKYFREALTQYFAASMPQGNPQIVEKIINHGRLLADSLLGEDFQLFKVAHLIATADIKNLDVEICSDRAEFFGIDFEALILPETNYILSSACKSFSRKFLTLETPREDIQKDEPSEAGELNVLYSVCTHNSDESALYQSCIKSLTFPQKINYEIILDADLTQYEKALSCLDKKPHVFHFEGCLRLLGDKAFLASSLDDLTQPQVDFDDVLLLLHKAQIKVLFLSFTACEQDGNPLKPALGAAYLASRSGGLDIVGFNYLTNPWTRAQNMDLLYEGLASGLALPQAIVGARKELQSNYGDHPLSANSLDFHPWLLLCHYSGTSREIRFLDVPAQQTDPLFGMQPYSKIRQKLFGFDNDLLPPDNLSSTSANFLQALALVQKGQSLKIFGPEGAGKTHLTHKLAFYWCATGACEYAFYFDFSDHYYTKQNVLEMIAPVFGINAENFLNLERILSEKCCCFVFDGIEGKTDNPELQDREDLVGLMRELEACHRVVIAQKKVNQEDRRSGSAYILPSHTISETRILACKTLSDLGIKDKENLPEFSSILKQALGNAFVVKKAMYALLSNSSSEVLELLQTIKKENALASFLDAQWQRLPFCLQQLLLVMLNYDTLYFELLCTTLDKFATEKQSDFKAAEDFRNFLNAGSASFIEAAGKLEASGFLVRKGHGRLIDLNAKTYLKTIYNESIPPEREAEAKKIMSQLLCESLRQLAPMMHASENQAITYHLISNRGIWARCLESLWFDSLFSHFFACKAQLDALLAQANLQAESNAWAYDLLKRTPKEFYENALNIEGSVAWLTLTKSAFAHTESHANPLFLIAEQYFSSQLDGILSSIDAGFNGVLFNHVVNFLESYYFILERWQDCYVVSKKAYDFYVESNKVSRMIRSLKSMALCCQRLEQFAQALSLEEEMLKLLWSHEYDIPEQTVIMLSLECLENRVARDPESAQKLLNDLTKMFSKPGLKKLFQRYQADIYHAKNQSEQAAKIYAELLRDADKNGSNKPEHSYLQTKLAALADGMGRELFEEACGFDASTLDAHTVH